MLFLNFSKYPYKTTISILLYLKFISQTDFPKLFSKSAPKIPKIAVLQIWCLKLLCKIFPQNYSCSPKKNSEFIPQNCFPKWLPAIISQNCSPKYRRKAVTPKLLWFKPISQGRFPKLFSKAAPQSYSAMLLPKDTHQIFVLKLVRKATVFQNFWSKLPRKAPPPSQNCSPKLLHQGKFLSQTCFLKLFPKAVVLQSNYSSMLL